MTDLQQNNAPDPGDVKIPAQYAEQIRRISHDLSNALEVILQTNYLLGMVATADNTDQQKWREMLEQGVTQATQINRQLRDYVRAHC
jgi:signal transduction histidine kinase